MKGSKDVIVVTFLKRNLLTAKVFNKNSTRLDEPDLILYLETRQAKT